MRAWDGRRRDLEQARFNANTLGLWLWGPMASLGALGRLLGAPEDVLENLARINMDLAGGVGLRRARPTTLPRAPAPRQTSQAHTAGSTTGRPQEGAYVERRKAVKVYGEGGREVGELDRNTKVVRVEPETVPTPLEPHRSEYFDGRSDLYGSKARFGDRALYFTDEAGVQGLLERKNYFTETKLVVRTTTLGELLDKYPSAVVLQDNALDNSWIFVVPR